MLCVLPFWQGSAVKGMALAVCGSTRGTLTPLPWFLCSDECLLARGYQVMDTD